MIEKLLKLFFDCIDYFLASQVSSKMGFGHQIDSTRALGANSRFMINIVANFNKPVSIIELASGRGVLAGEIIKLSQVKYYLACDIDPSGLEVLQKRMKKNEHGTKLETKVMNSLDSDMKETEVFDIVIAEKLLHLLSPQEIKKIFKFANSILKPGGLFIISSASETNFVHERTEPGEEHELYRKLKGDMLTRLWYNIKTPYVFFITKDYIKEVSEETGFSMIDFLIYNNTEDYLTLAVCKNSPELNL